MKKIRNNLNPREKVVPHQDSRVVLKVLAEVEEIDNQTEDQINNIIRTININQNKEEVVIKIAIIMLLVRKVLDLDKVRESSNNSDDDDD